MELNLHGYHDKTLLLSRMIKQLAVYLLFFLFWPFAGFAQVLFEAEYDVPLSVDGKHPAMAWLGGLNSGQYGKADLDGDGKEELIIYNRTANSYLIFSFENGSFRVRPDLAVVLPDLEPGWVVFADYNRDGLKDIFSNGERGIVVHENISASVPGVQWKKVADPLRSLGYSGMINIIANAADVPGISDIDDDGDLDIIVYNFAIGGYIRYHKNLSMEKYGIPDSLDYELNTRRWGLFEECDCNLFAFYPQTCSDVDNGRVMHPGGKALLAIDVDGDGDKDLLAGHEQCDELYYFENIGTPDSAFMDDYEQYFPDSAHPALFPVYPAGFFEDMDADGIKDLIVAPCTEYNVEFGTDFSKSSWFYKNTGTNDKPDFQFVKKDLYQKEMLDLGERSVPELVDMDADGDLDLLVAANGWWNGQDYSGKVVYFENTGSPAGPSFEQRDDDFLHLTAMELHNPKIRFADFNGDGMPDLVYTGIDMYYDVYTYVFDNMAQEGMPWKFDPESRRELLLPMTMNDNPEFYDVNGDGLVDLLVGKQNGALEYYVNVGSAGDEDWKLEDGEFLGIGRDFTLERIALAVTVCDIDGDGEADLVTSDYRGTAQIYFDFQKNEDNPTPVYIGYKNNVIDEVMPAVFGWNAQIAAGDIYGEGSQSILAGGARGGIQIFRNEEPGSGPGEKPAEIQLSCYPNPVGSDMEINIKSNQDVDVEVFDVLGRLISAPISLKKYIQTSFWLHYPASGIYLLKATNKNGVTRTVKIVVVK